MDNEITIIAYWWHGLMLLSEATEAARMSKAQGPAPHLDWPMNNCLIYFEMFVSM